VQMIVFGIAPHVAMHSHTQTEPRIRVP
jgi:hypothetical protein